MSITKLPVGTNTISFSRSKTKKGIEYSINGEEAGWNFVLKLPAQPQAKYHLNGKPVPYNSSGIRMTAANNTLLVIP